MQCIMDSVKKCIIVNPDFMRMGGYKRRALKKSINKNRMSTRELKENLIRKIRQHREREELKSNKVEEKDRSSNDTEFTDSLAYLDKLAKQKHRRQVKTRKKLTIHHKRSLIPIIGTDGIPYGNLKHGTKQTYRQYMRTKNDIVPKVHVEGHPSIDPKHSERKERLQEIKTECTIGNGPAVDDQRDRIKALESQLTSYRNFIDALPSLIDKKEVATSEAVSDSEQVQEPVSGSVDGPVGGPIPVKEPIIRRSLRKIRRTLKRRLGKLNGKMGVLVKNAETRKNVQRETSLLKDTSMGDIRAYLKDHSLLKTGSAAPESMLRRTYEDAVLTGFIRNRSKDVLVHNYMTDELGTES